MPSVQIEGGVLNYELEGPADQPVLVLSNSLGTSLNMWDTQIPEWTRHFRVLRYDTRGHGASSVTPGPYSIEQLGQDVLALLDALKLDKVFFCGLSMGGLIGQWLGINASDRLHKLIICNTAAKIAGPDVWNPRIEMVLRDKEAAMVGLRDASIARWFTPGYAAQNPEQAKRITDMLAATSPEGYAANCAAVRDADFREQLGKINVPMMVISGTEDAVTPPSGGEFIRERVKGCKHVEFFAAHLSNVEVGEAFTRCVIDFLLDGSFSEKERYDAGMKVRRAVLGEAHVDRSLKNLTDFNGEFQEMITRHAWGDIWTRPGLPRHTRSLITIAMLIGMNRNEELKLHLRAAANNGVTREEIKEVLMQSAIYCGIPAANATFHLAESVWDELGIESRQ